MILNKKIQLVMDEAYCELGLVRWLDFDCFHKEGQRVLVCGPSGSGKTVLSTSILGKLSLHLPNVLVYLVDYKGIDFRFCEGCANYYPVDSAIQFLE